jgi:hypothetical protein
MPFFFEDFDGQGVLAMTAQLIASRHEFSVNQEARRRKPRHEA